MQKKKFISKVSATALAGLMGASALMPGINAAAATDKLSIDSSFIIYTNPYGGDGSTYVSTINATKYGMSGEKVRLYDTTNGADNIVGFSVTSQDTWGLCLRPSVTSGASGSGSAGVTASTAETNYWSKIPKDMKYAMSLAMFYGYPNAVSKPKKSQKDATAIAYFKATQIIIWEYALGLRKWDPDDGTSTTLYKVYSVSTTGNNIPSNSLIKYFKADAATKDAYNDISNKMIHHKDVPSNMWAEKDKAKAANSANYNSDKSIVMRYSFSDNKWHGKYTIKNATNSSFLSWNNNGEKGATFQAIKKLAESWNSNGYYGSANAQVSLDGNVVNITTDTPPFSPTKDNLQRTGIISQNVTGKQGDGWIIYAVNNDHQDIAFGSDDIDPTRGLITVATPNYGNITIFKEFEKNDETAEDETIAKNYISKVSFTLETKANNTTYYVLAEKVPNSNNWKVVGTTDKKSEATKITLDTSSYNSLNNRFKTIVCDLPASVSNARTYTVREYAPAQGNYPAINGESVGAVKVNKYDNESPFVDASMSDVSARTIYVTNAENADFSNIKLQKRLDTDDQYDAEADEDGTNLDANLMEGRFIPCVYYNNEVYYLKKLSTTAAGGYRIPNNALDLHAGTFASDAVTNGYLTKSIGSAESYITNSSGVMVIRNFPKGLKFGFIEVTSPTSDATGGAGFTVDEETYNNKIALSDLATQFKNATGQIQGVITNIGSPITYNMSLNPMPITFGLTSGSVGTYRTEYLDNVPYYVRLSLRKKDGLTGAPLSGAVFTLYKNGKKIDEGTSGTDGVIHFENYKFYDISVSTTDGYTFKETKAPDGYLLDETEYQVNSMIPILRELGAGGGAKEADLGYINQDIDDAFPASYKSYPVDNINYPYRGTVNLEKTETLNGTKVAGVQFAFTANQDLTANQVAAITVTKGKEISRASGAVKAGDAVITVETDANGSISMSNLYIGKLADNKFNYTYTATEVNMARGLNGKGPYDFNFYDNGGDARVVEGVAIVNSNVNATNTPVPVALVVNKKDNHDKPVANVAFNVYADEDVVINGQKIYSANDLVGTITTNASGVAKNYTEIGERGDKNYAFNLYGGFSYRIVEASVPNGIVLDATPHKFTADIKDDEYEISYSYTQTNRWYIGSVKLLKANSDTDEAISGATFGLWKDNGDKVFNEEEDVYIRNLVDKGDGNYVSADTNDLEYGTYWVKETQAPEGYVIDDNAYIAEIDQDGKVVTIYNSMDENNQKFYETPIKGDVELIKKDAETGDLLTGAEFTIYNDVNGDGIYNEGDTEYGMLSEEETGVYRLHDVVYGKYVVKETKAPDTFKPDTGDYPVNVTVNKETITVRNTETGDFADQPMKGGITLLKYDKDYPDNKLSGATFVVYKDTNLNNEIDDADEFMGNLVEDTENVGVYSITDLRMGQYLVKETVAPENFNLDEKTYTVILSNDGDFISVENEAGKGFANSPSVGTVTLTKYDARYPDHKLSGAVFNIWKDVNSNGEVDEEDIDLGALTEDDGVYSMSELRIGDYLVREIKAPVGFVLDEGTYEAHITMNGEVYQVINREDDGDFCAGFYNNIKKGDIEITKYDISESETLPNTGIRICKEDGTVVEEKYTDENGEVKFKELEYGKYYFEEFDAPEGYRLNTEKHYFEILEDGQVVHGKIVDEIIVGGIKITKYDISKSETLPNTGIRICKEDGTVVEEKYTDENGEVVFENLEYGKYYFEEFDAPDGYELNTEKHYFEITEDGVIIHGEITDEKIPTPPPTGVENNMAIPMMAGAVSAMGLAAVTIVAVAKKKRED